MECFTSYGGIQQRRATPGTHDSIMWYKFDYVCVFASGRTRRSEVDGVVSFKPPLLVSIFEGTNRWTNLVVFGLFSELQNKVFKDGFDLMCNR